MDNAKEYPFYYPLTPAPLKQFASTKLALDLWRCKGFDSTNTSVTCPDIKFSCEEILQIALPSSIREVIDKRIDSIRIELKKLFDNFNELDIIENLNQNAVECLNCITYGPDGTLSMEATVKNMLASENLSVFEKYMIACVYRFDKEIKKFWPFIFDSLFVNKAGSGNCQEMSYSSTSLMATMSEDETSETDLLDRSERFFYRLMNSNNWTGMEYFLDCIGGIDEQCRVLSHTLVADGFKNIKYVLPKLNRDQVDYLLRTYPHRIILELAFQEGYFEYVLKIWSHVKESITEADFCTLLSDLISCSYFIFNIKCWDYDQITQAKMVLHEIWTSASNRLKNEFLNHGIFTMFSFLMIIPMEKITDTGHSDLDFEFFSRLLADMSVELRTRIWTEHWIIFLIFFNLQYFEKFMRFCLRNDEIEEFVKNNMLDYEKCRTRIEFLLKGEFYGNIVYYIDFCSRFCVDNLVEEFKKRVRLPVLSNLKRSKFENLIELGAFVAKMSTNVDEESEVKKTIFYSDDIQKLLVSKLKEGLTNEVISVTERFLSTERSLRERQLFRDYWINFLAAGLASEVDVGHRWSEFLSWWKGDDDCTMFKQFLPVDEIFETLLIEVISKLALWLGPQELKRVEPVPSSAGKLEEFALVDDFLMWCFGTEVGVRNYKWSKILSYQNMPMLKNLLSINNECIVNDALRWFFNGDLIEVGNFKDSYKKNMRL